VGWTYVACLIVTLAAVAPALQSILPQISAHFEIAGQTAVNAVLLGCGLLLVTTWLNSAGVGLLTRVNNLGVFTELIGVLILIAALCVRAVRPVEQVLFPPPVQGRSFLAPLLVSAAMTASYVLYGFDTAGSLAEETKNPRRNAPRGILRALAAASGLGMLVLLFALMAAGDLKAGELSRVDGGLAWLVKSVLGERFGTILLCDVVFAIMVCALAVHAGAVRLIFAMARDGKLPFSGALARVSPGTRTPVVPAIVTGGLAILILAVNVNLPRLIELVTMVAVLWANLAYLFVTVALFRRRLVGWPASPAFSLGRWGIPVNIAAAAWSAFMVLNVGWPRAEIYGADWPSRFAPLVLTGILLSAGISSYFFMQRHQLRPASGKG
jgi:amino acid transporter